MDRNTRLFSGVTLSFGVSHGQVQEGMIDGPTDGGKSSRAFLEQAGKLLAACHQHLHPIVLCALETGRSKSEILGLRWKEIKDGAICLAGGGILK